jgi:hypothetical protein
LCCEANNGVEVEAAKEAKDWLEALGKPYTQNPLNPKP